MDSKCWAYTYGPKPEECNIFVYENVDIDEGSSAHDLR